MNGLDDTWFWYFSSENNIDIAFFTLFFFFDFLVGADLSDADLRGADFSLANVTKVSS